MVLWSDSTIGNLGKSKARGEIMARSGPGPGQGQGQGSVPKKAQDHPPVIQHQRVIIQNMHGEMLVGILHDTGSEELVIVCHGFRSSKDRIPMLHLADAFGKDGISAFRFDFAGNGESEGSFQYGNYHREVDDLHTVVQHFHGKRRCVPAIIGHSKGGNVVLLYASRYNNVQTVVNISGRFNLERGIQGRLGKDFLERIEQNGFIDVNNKKGNIQYRVTKKSLMDRLTTNTRAACQMIHKSCRVLTIHGSKDEIVPVEDAIEFSKCIANHRLHIVQGADHEFTKNQDDLGSVVLDFIRAGLHQDSCYMSKQTPLCSTKHKIFHSRY